MEPFFLEFLELWQDIPLQHRGRVSEFERGIEHDPELASLLIEAVSKNDTDLVQV